MTPQEWQSVADQLALPWGSATLICDGYRLSLRVVPRAPLRYEIAVYVNGWIKGEWSITDCEERRRFLRPVQVAAYSPAEKKRALHGVRRPSKAFREQLDRRFTVFLPAWKSFSALRRHLVANNGQITIAPTDTTPVAAAAEVA